ncbi:MAG: PEP-CTERM sorting domain-containing protein [Planctomycetia bacterium]|nr:PEP-CTERM sorting domain-containing protein [Planctomycetia bacterium]
MVSGFTVTNGHDGGSATGQATIGKGDNITTTTTKWSVNADGNTLFITPALSTGYSGFSNGGDYTFVTGKSSGTQPFSGGTYKVIAPSDGVLLSFVGSGVNGSANTNIGTIPANLRGNYNYTNATTGASGTFTVGEKAWYTTPAQSNNWAWEYGVGGNFNSIYFPKNSGFLTATDISMANAETALSTAFKEQGIHSVRDGVLITNSYRGNGDSASTKAMPLADGSGYNLQMVNATPDDTGNFVNNGKDQKISYAFLPYGTEGLAAGQIVTRTSNMWTNGDITESFALSSTDNFTVTREAKGQYRITFSEKSGFSSQNGALFINGFASQGFGKWEGYDNVREEFKSFFTYKANDDGSYTIYAKNYATDYNYQATDASFSFAYVSYDGLGEAKLSDRHNYDFNPGVKGSSDYAGGYLGLNYAYKKNNYTDFSNLSSTAQYMKLDTLSQQGDLWIALNGQRVGCSSISNGTDDQSGFLSEGILFATVAQNGQKAVAKADPTNWRGLISTDKHTGGEITLPIAAAYFPQNGPWTIGRCNGNGESQEWNTNGDYTLTKIGTGDYTLKINNGSPDDGVLLAIARSNEDVRSMIATPDLVNGTWNLAMVNPSNGTLSNSGQGFSFVYIPSQIGSEAFISGYISPDGVSGLAIYEDMINIEHTGTGQWEISSTENTEINFDTSFLLLTAADENAKAYMSYEPVYNDAGEVTKFIVEAMSMTNNSALMDTTFAFALMSSDGFMSTGVPEPSTLILLFSGLAGIFWLRKKSKKG